MILYVHVFRHLHRLPYYCSYFISQTGHSFQWYSDRHYLIIKSQSMWYDRWEKYNYYMHLLYIVHPSVLCFPIFQGGVELRKCECIYTFENCLCICISHEAWTTVCKHTVDNVLSFLICWYINCYKLARVSHPNLSDIHSTQQLGFAVLCCMFNTHADVVWWQ